MMLRIDHITLKVVISCFAIFWLSACINVAKRCETETYSNKEAAQYSVDYKKGERQAKLDIQAGIYAVPHFFNDIGDPAIIQRLFEDTLRIRCGVDYCCLGNGSGYKPKLSEFVNGYNSIAIPELKNRLQGRSLKEIYDETEKNFTNHKHEFRTYAQIQTTLICDKEVRGLNAERLLSAGGGKGSLLNATEIRHVWDTSTRRFPL